MEAARALYQRLTASATTISYQAVDTSSEAGENEPLRLPSDDDDRTDDDYRGTLHRAEEETVEDTPFSWLDYAVFLLLGVAMLWAWNMFLAAGPYFRRRFQGDDAILRNFQPAELSVSTVVNLGAVVLLANLQAKASYSGRIIMALILNVVSFTMLAMSTRVATGVSPSAYFAFLMVQILVTAIATSLLQNGIFAYVSGFGREEYTQGIMTGQAVAGVAPCIVQIVSVLSSPAVDSLGENAAESSSSALTYFLTAAAICFCTLLAFLHMVARRRRHHHHYKRVVDDVTSLEADTFAGTERATIPLLTLAWKTRWLASAVFLTFGVTMFFPVLTQKIQSVQNPDTAPRIFLPATFVPLALFCWNAGDLTGRLLTAIPAIRITAMPRLLLGLAILRVAFVPLYYLCNINGTGAVIPSDFFYLIAVQYLFGVSNGFIGSICMMGAVEYVEPEEREATGGFMGMCLVAGLTVGSLLSFLVA